MSASRPRRPPCGHPRMRSSRRSSGSTSSNRIRWPRSSPAASMPTGSLADHAFADRIHRRAGTVMAIGAGSLVVAPDLRAGVPSDPATRSGRALGLQALAVALAQGRWPARRAGRDRRAAHLDRRRADVRGALDRRGGGPPGAVSGSHPLAFIEPDAPPDRMAAWPHLLAASLVGAGDTVFVMRRPGRPLTVTRETRAAATIANEAALSRSSLGLTGVALDHARGAVTVGGRDARPARRPAAGRRSPASRRPTVRRARSAAMRSPFARSPSTRSRPWGSARSDVRPGRRRPPWRSPGQPARDRGDDMDGGRGPDRCRQVGR